MASCIEYTLAGLLISLMLLASVVLFPILGFGLIDGF
jgi:hypothetical protein